MTPAACAAKLKELFPALFTGAAKPLKLRIQADIQARAPGLFTKPVLSAFLRRYTGSNGYLIALSRAAQRFDLDGQPCAELSDEHRQAAVDELTRRRAGHEAQRALEDQQRQNRAHLLRDFQTTTLTEANFCALKGLPVEELAGVLEIARREAQERPPQQRMQPRPNQRQQPHGQQRPGQDRGDRGGRRPPRPAGDKEGR